MSKSVKTSPKRTTKKIIIEDVDNIMTPDNSFEDFDDHEESSNKSEQKDSLTIICQAITKEGSPCTSMASNQYGNMYCGRHRYVYANQKAIDKGYNLCKSTRKCKGYPSGTKAPLPKGYTGNICQPCLDAISERERELRSERRNQSTGGNNLTCVKCGKVCSARDMGVSKRNIISNKCKSCFEAQQRVENNRPKRYR